MMLLSWHDLQGLGSPGGVLHAKAHALSLFKVAETVPHYVLIVNENISFAIVWLNETPALHPTEPLDRSSKFAIHGTEPPSLLAFQDVRYNRCVVSATPQSRIALGFAKLARRIA
jgi:hypothetical protein